MSGRRHGNFIPTVKLSQQNFLLVNQNQNLSHLHCKIWNLEYCSWGLHLLLFSLLHLTVYRRRCVFFLTLGMFVFDLEVLSSYQATLNFHIIRMQYNPEKYIKLQGVMGVHLNQPPIIWLSWGQLRNRVDFGSNLLRYFLVKLHPSIFCMLWFQYPYVLSDFHLLLEDSIHTPFFLPDQ